MTPSLPRVAPTSIVVSLLLFIFSMMPTGPTSTGALLLLSFALRHGVRHAEAAAHVGSLSGSLSQSDSSEWCIQLLGGLAMVKDGLESGPFITERIWTGQQITLPYGGADTLA